MNELKYTPVPNKLRVCHFPNIPCKPFIVEVKSEEEAYLVEQVLANQHLWLYKNNFIPDYSNAITVEMWDDIDGEGNFGWTDYANDYEGMDWKDLKTIYIEDDNRK